MNIDISDDDDAEESIDGNPDLAEYVNVDVDDAPFPSVGDWDRALEIHNEMSGVVVYCRLTVDGPASAILVSVSAEMPMWARAAVEDSSFTLVGDPDGVVVFD